MNFDPNDYSIVFLSYDEPNCEENFQHLLSLRPDALRVHGVTGSDTAHKKCAELSKTSRVIIVDGDNIVKPDFFNSKFELPETYNPDTSVLSFSAYNIVNGCQYGNGSIKSWPVSLIQTMKTHENGDPESIDFDFNNYVQLNQIASDVHINASPLQAWRSGFREGIKLTLDKEINWRNYDRLWRWMHLGADSTNGLWAIHGARFSVYLTKVTGWDYIEGVKNFELLDMMFQQLGDLSGNKLIEDINRMGTGLRLFFDKKITESLSASDSKQYKNSITSILRAPDNKPYDIVFISYNESYADVNYQRLINRFPGAKRINGVTGIHSAHKEAAKLCSSDYFWVVDADAEIVDTFNFDYTVPFYEEPKVRVWRSKNAVNDLIYGNGGVKLLPRMNVIRMSDTTVDMTTSISNFYEPIFELSNINNFNSDEFNAWRSAFRECVKLSSQVIDRQVSDETKQRLDVWCSVGLEKPFGKYVLDGAISGREYGERHKDNKGMLNKINDYTWLKKKFENKY